MAEQVISPGVFQNENIPVTLEAPVFPEGAAIVGPTVIGPVNIPTVVTTYSEYKRNFGSTFVSGGNNYSYFTSISAQNYFAQGGQRLLVTRVANGTFTSATSSAVFDRNSGTVTTTADALLSSISQQPSGANASYTDVSSSDSANNITCSLTLVNNSEGVAGSSVSTITVTATQGTFHVGDTITIAKEQFGGNSDGQDIEITVAAGDLVNDGPFTLTTISQGDIQNSSGFIDPYSPTQENTGGVLASGSKDNLRWEINNVDTGSGNFTLVVREGDDRTEDKKILETFRNVNLDPRSSNFIARRVGSQIKSLNTDDSDNPYISVTGEYPNKSKYIVVSKVFNTTPDYLDEDGNVRQGYFTGSVPVNQSGSFGGADGSIFNLNSGDSINYYENITSGDTQGVDADDYTNVFKLLKNKDEFPFNIISAPGLISGFAAHKTELDVLINNVTFRGDSIIPIDLVEYGAAVSSVVIKANDLNTSYAAAYWPWVKVRDVDLNKNVWVPASTLIPSVYAANDQTSDAWFAPAGFTRGALPRVVTTERALKRSLRDTLYSNKVNPISSFPNVGFVIFGQKTLQSAASATDRVNVRRLLIALKKFISDTSQNLVFEPNTLATRNAFLSVVNPYLETVQQRQGLYAFKVVMDATNNGPQVVDRNELRGAIYLQPTKTAEFIILDFNVLPTGAEFPS